MDAIIREGESQHRRSVGRNSGPDGVQTVGYTTDAVLPEGCSATECICDKQKTEALDQTGRGERHGGTIKNMMKAGWTPCSISKQCLTAVCVK